MNVRKGSPGRGAGPRPDSFSYTSVPHGTKNAFNAWMAGPPYWCEEAHEHTDDDPGTKPCLHWMTEGALKCARCRRGRPVRCIGWVPLYREIDTKPIIVIVHESVSDTLEGLRYGHYVLVGRVSSKDSVFVKRSESNVTMVTNKESRKRPVDVVPDLLAMWQLPELNEWLRGHSENKEPNAVANAPGEQTLSVPPPTSRIESLALDAHRKAPSTLDVTYDHITRSLRTNAKKLGSNGHHSTNGEG